MRAEDKQRINELREERRSAMGDRHRVAQINSEIGEIQRLSAVPEPLRELMAEAQPLVQQEVPQQDEELVIGGYHPLGGAGFYTAEQAKQLRRGKPSGDS